MEQKTEEFDTFKNFDQGLLVLSAALDLLNLNFFMCLISKLKYIGGWLNFQLFTLEFILKKKLIIIHLAKIFFFVDPDT